MNIKRVHFNGFLELAMQSIPNEACGFLYTRLPYDISEIWDIFPLKNVSDDPKNAWQPDSNEVTKVKRMAHRLGLTKIGNIHSHPYVNKNKTIAWHLQPSDIDLKFAQRFSDVIRGIIVVTRQKILGIGFHDRYGKKIDVSVYDVAAKSFMS